MTIWTLLEECAQQLDEPFRRSEIVGWFRRHHPEVLEESLAAHIQGATAGAPGRGPFASRAPLLERIERGVYRRAGSGDEPAAAIAMPGAVVAVLVGCVKGKRSTPAPAGNLYTSALFLRRRAYAQARGLPWFVLSAEHGLVWPDALLEPYERALADQPTGYRDAWGAWVAAKLEDAIGDLAGRAVEVHAGSAYVDAVRGPLERRGCMVELPLRGLHRGEQLAWYDANMAARGAFRAEHRQVVQLAAELTDVNVEIGDVRALEPFTFRWPDGDEVFESGWSYRILVEGENYQVRHGLGSREVYGRHRVHTVTWLDNEVQVEGVEADDYPSTSALISVLRRPDKGLVQTIDEVLAGYGGFDLVEHRREIEAKWSRHSLGVKIREDDLAAWGLHAWLRMRSRTTRTSGRAPSPAAKPSSPLPPPPTYERRAVATALLAHGEALATALGGQAIRLTPNDEANALIHDDPFAFLIAVICDQGILADRAWAIPRDLKQRLGHLDPERMAVDPDTVRAAFAQAPKLHRFFNDVAGWVWRASDIVVRTYDGDAARIWNDEPAAAELRARFDAFPGIGQKKAAMAVEILERQLHVKLTELAGSDIAFDVHVRRVFLRTGFAERDDVGHMVAVARSTHPERPGELDNPAWDIGRRWCRPRMPDCPSCPLLVACPRLIERGDAVKGF